MSIFSLVKKPDDVQTPIAQASLEDLLDELNRYGAPRLSKHDIISNGKDWLCSLKVRVTATGVTFDVDAWAPTHREAVLKCRDNLHAALKQMGGAT
jgi:hypothetical protein